MMYLFEIYWQVAVMLFSVGVVCTSISYVDYRKSVRHSRSRWVRSNKRRTVSMARFTVATLIWPLAIFGAVVTFIIVTFMMAFFPGRESDIS